MKKGISIVLALSLLAALFSGCSRSIDNSGYVPTGNAILMEGQDPEDIAQEEEDTQELTLAYYPDRSLNPLFGSDYTNRVIMSLMYQGLFAVSNQKVATPILCSSYRVSANTKRWVFYLENNATFSDGTHVTPQDVVASYERAQENDYYKGRFFHVHSIEILEDDGIAFNLDTPYENLPLLLDVPIVKSSEVAASGLNGDIPLGTGPYTFSEGVGGANLYRNPSWWGGSLKIPATDPTITLVDVASVGDVRDAFQFGDVSVVCTNPMSASFAEYRSDYELWEIESGYMLYFGCNVTWSKFFDDGTLRKMLTYALDRETLSQEAYKGLVDCVTLPCDPAEVYYSNTLAEQYEYDSMKFLDLIRGYAIPQKEKGGNMEFRLLINSDDSARVTMGRLIASSLTDLGLPCTTLECTNAVYKSALQANNFDGYLGMTRLSPTMDLTEFFRPWGEMSWGGLNNSNLYDLTLKSLENSGTFYNLHKTLADDGRIIPLMFGHYNVYAQRGLIPDLDPARDNVFYYSMGKSMEDIQQPTVYD